jgi:hypothetical protein
MTNDSLIDVVAKLGDALDDGQGKGIGPNGVPLHLPPMDGRPIGTPAIILEVPELMDYLGTVGECPQYEWRAELLIVAPNTTGVDLVGTVDAVLATLHAAGYQVGSGTYTSWQPPDSPSPFPAYTLTVE